jgi:hypothetical protein
MWEDVGVEICGRICVQSCVLRDKGRCGLRVVCLEMKEDVG